MVIFHFTLDLQMFGHVPAGTIQNAFWANFARLIAGSFLFLAGVSLVLAHGRGIRWGAFGRRLAMVVAGALAVTLVTYIGMRDSFIYYGILHSIAVASVISLAFLRLPAAVTALVAVGVFMVPAYVSLPAFNSHWLAWTGLAETIPRSLDFEPLFPWLAPCLMGVAFAKAGTFWGLWEHLRTAAPSSALARRIAWPGRHSLVIYLLHQPIIFGLMYAHFMLTR